MKSKEMHHREKQEQEKKQMEEQKLKEEQQRQHSIELRRSVLFLEFHNL